MNNASTTPAARLNSAVNYAPELEGIRLWVDRADVADVLGELGNRHALVEAQRLMLVGLHRHLVDLVAAVTPMLSGDFGPEELIRLTAARDLAIRTFGR